MFAVIERNDVKNLNMTNAILMALALAALCLAVISRFETSTLSRKVAYLERSRCQEIPSPSKSDECLEQLKLSGVPDLDVSVVTIKPDPKTRGEPPMDFARIGKDLESGKGKMPPVAVAQVTK